MSIRIIKGTDCIPVEHPVFLLFGQPGICKSSLGYSTKEPLTLDFDHGAHRAANRRDTLLIESWDDVIELMASQEELAKYSSIVTDTVGRCLDLITADIAKTDPKKAPGGNLSQQGWGVLKNRFRAWTSQVRNLNKDLLLIAHDKEDKDGETRIVRPDIAGGSYGEVMKIADFVGYVYMSGKERVLDFNPTDRWVAKNPAGWTPFKVPAIGKATTFMAELFDKGRAALGKISEESAKAAQSVDLWRVTVDALTTAADCNDVLPKVLKLNGIIAPQVKKILWDRSKDIGLVYDGALGLFVMKPEAVVA
jgi:hypothetical protein